MNTTNAIANHIINKQVTKYMERSIAVRVWNDLKKDGWEQHGATLNKDGNTFVFNKSGGKIKVNFYSLQEVEA
jgi:hypothetical protein